MKNRPRSQRQRKNRKWRGGESQNQEKLDTLLDYELNNPTDPLRSAGCVGQRKELIQKNLAWCQATGLYAGQESGWRN